MALVNDAKKEIHAKIVYYGPGRSGKTTNLEFIYNKLKPEYRGKFKFMNTPSGRMVFFDFMRPELAAIRDFGIHFHIYTVPGESVEPAVWKSVLKGADGIVFVADLEPARTLENRRSLDSLKEYLQDYGVRLDELPCIFQCNKRDAADAVSVDEVRTLLDIGNVPVIPAAARSGEGVLPALSEMVKMVLQRLRDLPLAQEPETAPAAVESVPDVAVMEETAGHSIALEPESLADDSETLTLEPVEEDVDYAMEPEPGEVARETPEPAFAAEPPPMVAGLEMYGTEPPEPAESGIAVETEFQAPSWEYAQEPDLSTQEEPSSGYGEWSAQDAPGAGETEIELDGGIESMGNGRFRLPLVVRCGGKETRAALTFDVSLDKLDP